MSPGKWNEKRERDLLFAMRIAEHGYDPMPMKTWAKTANIMNMMGYQDATDTGVSQRWSKSILKDFQKNHPQALDIAAGTAPGPAAAAAAGSSSAPASNPAPTPARAPRGRPQKRKRAQEVEEDDDDEEVAVKKDPDVKKQKKQKKEKAEDEDAEDAEDKA
ncbi:hypothetical protein HD806DRAFT_536394 [Xylariaceae sp. AK1471]|nr:hypothetical protein HD806DRAFT_536394 [Xylariaceae sp. AK1471]